MDVVLYNSVGCELARVFIDKEMPTLTEIALATDWVLEDGDYIKCECTYLPFK